MVQKVKRFLLKNLKKDKLVSALAYFFSLVDKIAMHLFRANWNRNLLQFIRDNLEEGLIVLVQDFAMNYNNIYQDEIQQAYWGGTQTTIHATVNFLLCPRPGCKKKMKITVVHISDDKKHDSFLARAVQRKNFQYLASLGIKIDNVIEFSDNCGQQYKSKRPFAELSKFPVSITRVFFGEKHGKSHADALFGRLKAWMTFNIKSGKFLVRNAKDFYSCCKEYYETKDNNTSKCQHNKIYFEYITPSDVRRHQDSDIKTVEGTSTFYSVRNTSETLHLQSREVPCICKPCRTNSGQCLNPTYTDEWKDHKLVPLSNKSSKYNKIEMPRTANINFAPVTSDDDDSDSGQHEEDTNPQVNVPKCTDKKLVANCVAPVQENAMFVPGSSEDFLNEEDQTEVLGVVEQQCMEIGMAGENSLAIVNNSLFRKDMLEGIPEDLFWEHFFMA